MTPRTSLISLNDPLDVSPDFAASNSVKGLWKMWTLWDFKIRCNILDIYLTYTASLHRLRAPSVTGLSGRFSFLFGNLEDPQGSHYF